MGTAGSSLNILWLKKKVGELKKNVEELEKNKADDPKFTDDGDGQFCVWEDTEEVDYKITPSLDVDYRRRT